MEYKLVLGEHMFVLCVETKHCQVACGFDSDSCTYKTTEPNALKHWLCVPITYLNSQWSILLHPVLAFYNSQSKSGKVWKLYANVEYSITVKKKMSTNQLLCYTLWTSFRFKEIQQGEKNYILCWNFFCNYLHCNGGRVQKLYANAECSVIVTRSTSELLCCTWASLSFEQIQRGQSTRQSPEQLLI